MKDRLLAFLEYLGIGQNKFAQNVGLSAGFVNNVGDGITSKSLNKILAVYPELNENWLLKGEGQMIKSQINNNVGDVINQTGDGYVNVYKGSSIKQDEAEEKYDDNNADVITILKKQIDIQNKQLKEKDEQIAQKDEQINKLINLLNKN